MKTMQTKILEELESAIKDAGFEPVVSYSAANMGRIYAMQGFETKVTVKFDFQHGYATLKSEPYPKGVLGNFEYNMPELPQYMSAFRQMMKEMP